ncbi:hypothetical protein E2C01_040089 [Portunus trituberculatus]|uniref:Tyr recombinase domain-containing protein n=1 Tax=Portunus trituberculatus TaxID=210409 RepID=A0A5B7FFI4_PORTR|nr:hypothetical protein [Portunus trituberculatus]
MQSAGIDLNIFSPHSTRSASTSKAALKLPLATVISTVGWSRESTFTSKTNDCDHLPLVGSVAPHHLLNILPFPLCSQGS